MEQRFEFEGAEVLALVEESRAADERLLTEAQRYLAAGVDITAPPGLWLMNDRGVYLRSNAGERAEDHVAYARGYRGAVQVGDEVMCEFIDAGPLAQVRAGDTLVVTLVDEKMRLSLLRDPA